MLEKMHFQPMEIGLEPVDHKQKQEPVYELKECWFRYEKHGADILRDLTMRLYPGEIFGVVGGNGSGKSTMLSVISGRNKPYRGKIRAYGKTVKPGYHSGDLKIAALTQDPRALFVRDNVRDDLQELLERLGLPEEERRRRFEEAVETMEIVSLLDSHPFDLSGGEQQRAAIAKVLLTEPEILLLDEPTKGMDAAFKAKFGRLLQNMRERGLAILLVSHDIEFCAAHSTRCGLFFDGGIVAENKPRAFFAGNHFYTTSANRMARQWFKDAILPQEVIELCSRQMKKR